MAIQVRGLGVGFHSAVGYFCEAIKPLFLDLVLDLDVDLDLD